MRDWALNHGTRIGAIVVLTLIALVLARKLLPRAVGLAMRAEPPSALTEMGVLAPSVLSDAEREQRIETIGHVLVRAVDVLVLIVAILIVLSQAGFSIAPLLAGAGIAGIAIGFGAQSLVRDIISGLFILLENQFTRGDIVNVAGLGGVVEDLNLRRTILRDLDGVLHSVPNGEIRVASNLTRGWARVNLDVSVAYETDLSHARRVIDEVGRRLAEDAGWAEKIVEAPKVLRVDAFEDSGIAIKVLATTQPTAQWEVAGELRERLKIAFENEGIEIPYPHQVVELRAPAGEKE
jgi:small conductance mechanosensitive channel